jgi:hypothetical protein
VASQYTRAECAKQRLKRLTLVNTACDYIAAKG